MALTLTTADAALKEDYQPAMREQLNNTVFLLTQIERNSKDVEGRRAVLSLHVKRNSGVGARGAGGTLPAAGNQGYAEERVPLRYNYGRIEIDGPTMRAMKSDKGSFVRALDSETKGAVTDLRRDVNRQLFGTSNGTIAITAVNTAVNAIVLDAATTAVQMRQFELDMIVDISSAATPGDAAKASSRTITAVNVATKTITLSGAAITTAAGDRVERQGAGGSGSSQKELTGLRTIVAASGTLFNVDPTTAPSWASHVDSTGGSPSENLFAKAMHNGQIAGGTDIDLWVTTDGVHRGFAANLTSLKRFANTVEVKGGYKGLEITAGGGNPVGLVWDRDCPAQTAFGLATSHLAQHEMSDWEWMDEDGAVLSRVSGKDAYEAVLFKYHELTTDKRNAHVLLTGLTES